VGEFVQGICPFPCKHGRALCTMDVVAMVTIAMVTHKHRASELKATSHKSSLAIAESLGVIVRNASRHAASCRTIQRLL